MKIGVFATFMSPLATPQMIGDFGRRAESMGLDSIWMGEHVALFDKNTFGYPGSKDGRIPVPEGGGMLDVTATFGFLAAATKRVRLAIVRFALATGCRLSECVELEWSAVDWDNRTVMIFGKGDKLAPIPMSAAVRELLWSLQGAHKTRAFVRASGNPISMSGLDTAFGRAMAKAGIKDFRFHDLRHTTATRLLRQEGNLRMVQKLLQHSDIATTARHAHVLDEDLRNALNRMATTNPEESPEGSPKSLTKNG
jgi:hypothetical protein